ncbi:uncharacterized protein BDV17DRAFT_292916 [Aspergillus undulatus]|uniref:uncharacterized protein n=1 Tax=Aspergillus undulatus TaxID=1810928 RepID=UPI003CCC90C0
MPFLGRPSSSPTQPPSTTREVDTTSRPIREYFNGMPHQPPQAPAHKAPGAPAPNSSRPHSTLSSSESETQFIWEDIEPPAEYLVYMNRSQTTLSTYSTPTQSHTEPQPESTMLNPLHPNPSSTSHDSTNTDSQNPPLYNDVSGAVVVDAHGFPRFLTPQEEADRKDTLQQAVLERMMGLPRRTEFSWDASGGPVLPRYEPPLAGAGMRSGADSGGGAGKR